MVAREENTMYQVIINNAETGRQHKKAYDSKTKAMIEYGRCCEIAERLNSKGELWFIELYDIAREVYISDEIMDSREVA